MASLRDSIPQYLTPVLRRRETVIDDARQSGCSIFSYRPTSSYRAKAQRESKEDYTRLAKVRDGTREGGRAMSKGKQGQDQLSALFSQRFNDREAAPTEQPAAENAPRRPGRPPKAIKRKTVSFFLQPKVAERLDDAYYAWNAGLSREHGLAEPNSAKWCLRRVGAARGAPGGRVGRSIDTMLVTQLPVVVNNIVLIK